MSSISLCISEIGSSQTKTLELSPNMNSQTDTPIFLVDAYSSPIWIKIRGRASYQNCGAFSDFIKEQRKKGKNSFCVDFDECSGIDSTVLGLLAGLALEVKKTKPQGSLTLHNVRRRNLELIENLGLHKIVMINPKGNFCNYEKKLSGVSGEGMAKETDILVAHENLVKIDSANEHKFQDVLAYLQSQKPTETRVENR